MINVSPDEYRQSIRYARKNTILALWLTRVAILMSVVLMIIISGLWHFKNETGRYAKSNAQLEQQLKDNNLEGTLKTVSNISENLKLIIHVLSEQVFFSKLIKQIGAVMPESSILSNIEINKIEGGIDLIADAKDQNIATQIQINLTDSNNKIFEKVDIISIHCDSSVNPTYPCRATFRALFTKNSPFIFSQKKAEAKQ